MLVSESGKTVKNAVNNSIFDDIYTPSIAQKPGKTKEQEAAILSLQKTTNLSRFLEANCDCI